MPSGLVMRLASLPRMDEIEVVEGFVDGVEGREMLVVRVGMLRTSLPVGVVEAEVGDGGSR